jgi:hypothetical protein
MFQVQPCVSQSKQQHTINILVGFERADIVCYVVTILLFSEYSLPFYAFFYKQ